MKVLIPAAGNSLFFKESFFPKLLVEISGVSMVERVMENLRTISEPQFLFIFKKEDVDKFHLDRTVKLLSDRVECIQLEGTNSGSVCSCLLACDFIEDEQPLLILNSDQVLEVDYQEILDFFLEQNYNAGVVTFNSVHPRWAYVETVDGEPVQFSEKKPISKNAIAGFYFFKNGRDFYEAAKKVLLKNNSLDGQFYLSSVMNELILERKTIGIYPLKEGQKYYSFYSIDRIKLFEKEVERLKNV